MDITDNQQTIRKGRFLREQVYKSLKASILNGVLAPNKRLIEEKLAGEMGTSRTPVREEDIEEVFGIRSVLEGYAGYLATSRATDDDIRSLEEIVKREEAYLTKEDTEEIIRLNTEFHETLYGAAKSSKLYTIINDLRDYIYRYRIIIFRYEGMAEISIKDHKDMIGLMKVKNARQVEKLVRKHIIRGGDLIKKKMKQESRKKSRKE